MSSLTLVDSLQKFAQKKVIGKHANKRGSFTFVHFAQKSSLTLNMEYNKKWKKKIIPPS